MKKRSSKQKLEIISSSPLKEAIDTKKEGKKENNYSLTHLCVAQIINNGANTFILPFGDKQMEIEPHSTIHRLLHTFTHCPQ